MRPLIERALAGLLLLAGCPGGEYHRGGGMADFASARGETNGRSLDFVSTKPSGAEWTIRIRGRAMWVAYAKGEKADELGSFNMSDAEVLELWQRIDAVDIPNRRRGKPDDDNGTVSLHLRDVTDDGDHDLETIFVSRETSDDDVIDLADFIADVVEKHRKERPAF